MNEIENKEIKNYCANEIIQIGAIKLNNNLKEIDSFSIFIKPEYNEIIKRIEDMTGITNQKVNNSKNFKEAFDEFFEWAGDDDFQIIAWSPNDFNQLKNESNLKKYNHPKLTYAFKFWKDFQKEFCILLGLKKNKRISLDLALDLVGTSFKGQRHNALSDIRNTVYLYKISKTKKDFEKDMKKVGEILFKKEANLTIGDILNNKLKDIKKDLK